MERIHTHKNGVWAFTNYVTSLRERERSLCWLPLGRPFQRRPLCDHHYDITQVHFIDLMEHADLVLKASQYETEAVLKRFKLHLEEKA